MEVRSQEGSCSTVEMDNILSEALGKDEYPGRIRAAGSFQTKTKQAQRMNLGQSQAYTSEINDLKAMMAAILEKQELKEQEMERRQQEMERREQELAAENARRDAEQKKLMEQVASLMRGPLTPDSERASCAMDGRRAIVEGQSPLGWYLPNEHDTTVQLAGDASCVIIAIGRLAPKDPSRQTTDGYSWVLIDMGIDYQAFIPCTQGNYGKRVRDVIGHLHQWPNQFIIHDGNVKRVMKRKVEKVKVEKTKVEKVSRPTQHVIPTCSTFSTIAALKPIIDYTSSVGSVEMHIPDDLNWITKNFFLLSEDIFHFANNEDISNAVISTYML